MKKKERERERETKSLRYEGKRREGKN